MIEPSSIAAVVAVGGAAFATGMRDGRAIAAWLALAMVASPFTGSGLPAPLALAARLAGALLAADLVWVSTRVRGIRSEGSPIGLTAQLAFAAAAFLIGLQVAPVQPLSGPVTQQAAAIAIMALAIIPLTDGEGLRVGVGAALLCLGLSMLQQAWLGPVPALDDLIVAVLLVGILGGTGIFAVARPSPARVAPGAEEPSLVIEHEPQLPDEPRVPQLDAGSALWASGDQARRRIVGAHPDVRRTRRPRGPDPGK